MPANIHVGRGIHFSGVLHHQMAGRFLADIDFMGRGPIGACSIQRYRRNGAAPAADIVVVGSGRGDGAAARHHQCADASGAGSDGEVRHRNSGTAHECE